MVLTTHDFRSHVPGSAARVLTVFRRPNPCDAHVGDAAVASAFHDHIFRFNVSMYDPIVMHILQSDNDTRNHELSLTLTEPLPFPDMISQIPSSQQVTSQVQIFHILKCIVHVDEKGVF